MPKSLLFVLSAVFLLVTGTFVSGTILTPYAQKLGATWFQIGLLSGSMYAVRLFAGTPVGRLADKRGTLAVLKLSLLLYPLIAIVYWLSTNVYALIAARLLHGLASAMMLPMGLAYIGQASPKGAEGKYTGVYNACILLASGTGPFVATLIASRFNYRATFVTLFILAVMAMLVLFIFPKSAEPEGSMEDKTHRAREERGNGERFLRNGRLLALSAVNIAQAVVSSLVGFFLIPYLKGKGMDLAITGSVVAAYNLVSGVIQLPMGRFSDRADKFRIAWISGAGTAAVLLLFPISKGIWAFGTAAVLTSVGSAALLSSTSALAVEVGRETGMGGTMGFLSTSNSVGMILGCISLSLMPGTGLGYGAFFYLSSGAVLVCTALFAFLWTVNSNKVRRRRE